jgi:hypothetical protein
MFGTKQDQSRSRPIRSARLNLPQRPGHGTFSGARAYLFGRRTLASQLQESHMKIATALVAAATMVAFLPSTAGAQGWQSMNQRKVNIERRIDMGVRNGSLTRREASNLRTRFANLRRLEWRYSRNGLSWTERRDLDRRYNALSNSVRVERHDRQDRHRRWR